MKIRNKDKDKGVTLVELVVCIAVAGVVGAILIRIMTSSTKLFLITKAEATVQIDVQQVSDYIEKLIMESRDVESLPTSNVNHKRYLIRHAKDSAIVMVYEAENRKLYLRNCNIVLTSHELASDEVDNIYETKLLEQIREENDGVNQAILSTSVTKFELNKQFEYAKMKGIVTSDCSEVIRIIITLKNDETERTCVKQINMRNSRIS